MASIVTHKHSARLSDVGRSDRAFPGVPDGLVHCPEKGPLTFGSVEVGFLSSVSLKLPVSLSGELLFPPVSVAEFPRMAELILWSESVCLYLARRTTGPQREKRSSHTWRAGSTEAHRVQLSAVRNGFSWAWVFGFTRIYSDKSDCFDLVKALQNFSSSPNLPWFLDENCLTIWLLIGPIFFIFLKIYIFIVLITLVVVLNNSSIFKTRKKNFKRKINYGFIAG